LISFDSVLLNYDNVVLRVFIISVCSLTVDD